MPSHHRAPAMITTRYRRKARPGGIVARANVDARHGWGAPRRSRGGRGAERSAVKLARHDFALRLHTGPAAALPAGYTPGPPPASPSGYAPAHRPARPQATTGTPPSKPKLSRASGKAPEARSYTGCPLHKTGGVRRPPWSSRSVCFRRSRAGPRHQPRSKAARRDRAGAR